MSLMGFPSYPTPLSRSNVDDIVKRILITGPGSEEFPQPEDVLEWRLYLYLTHRVGLHHSQLSGLELVEGLCARDHEDVGVVYLALQEFPDLRIIEYEVEGIAVCDFYEH